MADRLRIVLIEDNKYDAELIRYELDRTLPECDLTWLETGRDFSLALLGRCPDVILADYVFPLFDGLRALKLAGELCPQTPCIIVSGIKDQDKLSEFFENGAKAYVSKDELNKLVPTIKRVISESAD